MMHRYKRFKTTMAKSPQDNFIRCHAALHALLSHSIPSLQHAIDTWHQKITATTQPCSNPAQCPPYKKPSSKNNSCPECIAWAAAIEAQVYPSSAVNSLQWMNANSTLFSKDPLEAIKLFVLRMPANQRTMYSSLGDFDTASLLMIMGKFKECHRGNQIVFDNIQKVAQIRNSLAHLKHDNSLHLDEQTFNNYWTDITNLVNCLPGIGRPYFTQKTAQDVITKLTEIKNQSIPLNIQQEALKPLVDDMVLKSLQDNWEKLDVTQGEPPNPQLWQKQLKEIYRNKKRGIGFLPGFPREFPSDEFFVDLHLVKEQKSPTKVRQVDLRTYTDLLNLQDESGQSLRHVVVSGLGGTGKSTMVSRLAYQWAKVDKKSNEECLNKFDLVFLLDIRKFQQDMDLVDAIQSQLLTHVPKHHIETYLSANADKCLFLFDGYDELSAGERVLQSDLLCGGLVIVTTRPNKVDKFYDAHKDSMSVQVNLNGFSRTSIRQFVDKYFRAEANKLKKESLQENIERNDELRNLSHFPLLLAMICLIWNENNKLPNTISGLYQQVLEFMARHWKAREQRFDSMSIVEFKDQVKLNQTMIQLGKTAWQGLTDKSRLIFQVGEFDSQQIVEHGCSLGLMSSESKISGFDKITYVSFIHKTFQEYCAALYLSSLPETDVNLLKSYLSQMDFDDMEYVLRFCCGTSQKAAEVILAHVAQLTTEGTKIKAKSTSLRLERDSCRLPLILLFESESTFAVNSTLQTILRPSVENISMYLHNYESDPVYFTALKYIVDEFKSQCEWTTHVKMATIIIFFDGDVSGVLIKKQIELLNKMLHVKKLTIHALYSGNEDIELQTLTKHINRLISSVEEVTLSCSASVNAIHIFLNQLPPLTRLHLDFCLKIDSRTNLDTLTDILQTIHSKSGSIRGLTVKKVDVAKFIKYLAPFFNTLESVEFHLMNATSSQSSTYTLFQGMIQAGNKLNSHDSMSIEHADNIKAGHVVHLPLKKLDFFRLEPSFAHSIGQLCAATVFLSNIKTFKLSFCNLVDDSFQELGPALSNLTSLQHLDIRCNTIGGSLKAVIQRINHSKITHLDLMNTKLTKESKSALSLLELPLLEELYLSRNDIDSCDAKDLAVSLKHMPMLKYLILSNNILGSQGVMALCESFQYITHLVRVYLRDNKIGSDGAIALASALQHTSSLVHLDLAENQIQSDGAKALASALQYPPCRFELTLSYNQIQSDGIEALESAVQCSKSKLQYVR